MKLHRVMWRFSVRCLALSILVALPLRAATNVVTTLANSGPGSLRQVISNALPGDTIVFSTNGTITLTSGELFITKNLNIMGPGATNLAISGSFSSRVLNISMNSTCGMSGITIRDGRTSGFSSSNGAGIYNLGALTMDACFITVNKTGDGGTGGESARGGRSGSGGGIWSAGTVTLTNCVFTANGTGNRGQGGDGPVRFPEPMDAQGGRGEMSGDGGAIYNSGGTVVAMACTFAANSTGTGGTGGKGGRGYLNSNTSFSHEFGGNGGISGSGGRSPTGKAGSSAPRAPSIQISPVQAAERGMVAKAEAQPRKPMAEETADTLVPEARFTPLIDWD